MKKIILIFSCFVLFNSTDLIAQCATSIVGPSSICGPEANIFYEAPGNNGGNISWGLDGGGTFQPTGPSTVSVSWTTNGTWHLAASPACGPVIILEVTVGSVSVGAPTAITGPTTSCAGSTVVFSIPASGTYSQSTWFVTDFTLGSSTVPPVPVVSGYQASITFPNASNYLVSASYNNGSCSGPPALIPMIVSAGNAAVSISGNAAVCQNASSTYTATGDILDTFTWTLPDGSHPTGKTVTVGWNNVGTFTIGVMGNNTCSSPRSATPLTVVVSPAGPAQPGAITHPNSILCTNASAERFSISPVAVATSYNWTITRTQGVGWNTTTTTPYYDATFPYDDVYTMIVSSSNGTCVSVPSSPISINVGFLPVSIIFPAKICVGSQATLTAQSLTDLTQPGYVFSWVVNGGTIVGPNNTRSIIVTSNTPGFIQISLGVSSPCGETTSSTAGSQPGTGVMVVSTTPMSAFYTNASQCIGTYPYSVSGNPGISSLSWAITKSDGTPTSGGAITSNLSTLAYTTYPQGVNIAWNTPGNYLVTATATNFCGGTQSQTLPVSVGAGTKPTNTGFSNSYDVCAGSTISYSTSGSGSYTYNWTLANTGGSFVGSSTAQNVQVNWAQPGFSAITLTTTNGSCPSDPFTANIYVNATPTVSINGPSTAYLCGNTTMLLSATVTNANYYEWYKDGIPVSSSSVCNVVSPGTYTLTVSNNGCQVTSAPVTVVRVAIPQINAITTSTICPGQSANVALSSDQPGAALSWTSVASNNVAGFTSGSGSVINDVLTLIDPNSQGYVQYAATASQYTCSNSIAVNVYIRTQPKIFSVSGGGNLCTGGATSISLAGSETGQTYILQLNGVTVGSPITGTNSGISWSNMSSPGTYTVVTGLCSQAMSGSATITVYQYPTTFNVTGGNFCYGSSGTVTLTGSEVGVNYKLNNLPEVAGTGYQINWQGLAAGTYNVSARNVAASCTRAMTGTVTLTSYPSQTLYSVIGGGAFCPGGSGQTIQLTGSATGVNYQLVVNGINVGAPIAGTTGTLNWLNQTTPGAYTVVGTNTSSNCSQQMTATATVSVYTPPFAYSVLGSATICPGSSGTPISLTGSDTGVNYQLQFNGSNSGAVKAGTGVALSWPSQSGVGNYTVIGTSASNSCSQPMTGSATVSLVSVPHLVISGDSTVCQASAGHVYTTSSGQSNYIWSVSSGGTVTAGGTTTSNSVTVTWNTSGAQAVNVSYTASSGCTGSAPQKNVTVKAAPVATIAGKLTFCYGSSTTLTASTGTGYSWHWSTGATTQAISVSTAGTYTVTVTANGCSVVSSPVTVSGGNTPFSSVTIDGSTYSGSCAISTPYSGTAPTTHHIVVTPTTGVTFSLIDPNGVCTTHSASGGTFTYAYKTTNKAFTISISGTSGSCSENACIYFSNTSGGNGQRIDEDETQTDPLTQEFSLYPNPADKTLSVLLTLPATSTTPLRVYDLSGRLLIDTMIKKDEQRKTLTTENLFPGMYLVHVRDGEKERYEKIIITH
jgi:Secretion system C-terminal sorting domain/PKD-like domain